MRYTIQHSWDIKECPQFINTKSNEEWMELFKALTCRTQAQVTEQVNNDAKTRAFGIKIFRMATFSWLAVIPLLWGVFQFFGPKSVSCIAFVYSVVMFLIHLHKEFYPNKRKSEKELLKNHYHYHCQLNPEGFNRLKAENFDKERESEIQKNK